MNIVNPYRYAATGYDFTGAAYIYSLRKLTANTHAVLRVIRSSDNGTAYVFFNGATSYNSINLNSYISLLNSAIPDATTLTTWAGSDDVYVTDWIDQITLNPGRYISSATPGSGGTLTNRPKLMTSGAFITKNGLQTLEFNGLDALYKPDPITELNDANSFTVTIVASNDSASAKYAIFHTGRITANAFTMWMDSSAAAEMAYAYGTTTSATANYSAQNTTTNQRLITAIKTTTLSAWYNGGAESETGITWSGTYTNDEIYVGRKQNGSPNYLDGHIQECIIYASDESANRTAMEADINAYYGIY